jgi:hypothetical protein
VHNLWAQTGLELPEKLWNLPRWLSVHIKTEICDKSERIGWIFYNFSREYLIHIFDERIQKWKRK